MTRLTREFVSMPRVVLQVEIGDFSRLSPSPGTYHVQITRGDNMPLTEMELRSMLTDLSWAIDGEDSSIILERPERQGS